MTARILVVDDIPTNVRLLEARLMAEYFQVLTASNGKDALKICEEGKCDIVLLDVMMPEMDGFEVCKRLKSNPATMHLPVVMVTALDKPQDKQLGLEAGADDFLTKPVNDLALVTRVKSLARLKMITDDLRLRAANGDELAINSFKSMDALNAEASHGKIAVVDDCPGSRERLHDALSRNNTVDLMRDPQDALIEIAEGDYDLAVVSMNLEQYDSLRLCSYLRSIERTRTLPIMITAHGSQEELVSRAMEIGVNDFIRVPIEEHELLARVRTLLMRKRYHDCLRNSVQQTIEMAVKDQLTGLHNRRYFDTHGVSLLEATRKTGKALSAVMCDIDHFKSINDRYGHDVGDVVLKEIAGRITKNVRSLDLACRIGGEEFVILMPETDTQVATLAAERIREEIAALPVIVDGGSIKVDVTMSLGIASLDPGDETLRDLVRRADEALYAAKRDGRNRVVAQAA